MRLEPEPPMSHCVYRFFDANDDLLYVGCTGRFGSRLGNHAHGRFWWQYVSYIHVEHHPDEETGLAAEMQAILTENPIYNERAYEFPEPAMPRPAPLPGDLHPTTALLTVAETQEVLHTSDGEVRKLIATGLLETYRNAAGHHRVVAGSATTLRAAMRLSGRVMREDLFRGRRMRIRATREQDSAAAAIVSLNERREWVDVRNRTRARKAGRPYPA